MPTDRAMEKAREIDNRGGHATDIADALDAFAAEAVEKERREILAKMREFVELSENKLKGVVPEWYDIQLKWIEARGEKAR